MKKNINVFYSLALISLVVLTMVACGGKESEQETATQTADDRLGKLEVEIPDELKDNPEAVAYIEGMTEVADEYALLMDDMFEEVGDLSGKESEDLTMMEQLKLVKATGEVAVRSAEIMLKWGEYQNQRAAIDEQLSDEEIVALEQVLKHFEERMTQIAEKHEIAMEGHTES